MLGTDVAKVPLGSLCLEEPCYGTSATAIKRTDDSQPKYIRITDFDDFGIEENHEYMAAESYSSKHLLRPNDILFARTGGTVGKTYFYDGEIGEAVFAGYCIRFRFDERKVLPKFVYWYTKTDSYQNWVKGIQRPVGQPNINKEEYKSFEIVLPDMGVQQKLVDLMDDAEQTRLNNIRQTQKQLLDAKETAFGRLGISFDEYIPALYSFSSLGTLREIGIYCNPHSDYLTNVVLRLRNNKFYVGNLEEFVEVNPSTSRGGLGNSTPVAFVPMPAVEEKTNTVTYAIKAYEEVKTGFTIFRRDDLLWAKITPCMQNGKSFIASNMPTEIGFGSTEFHVLRKKDSCIYMPYLWVLLSDSHVLEAAQGMFSGSAGQQRVSDVFLKKFPLVLPPMEKQVELADSVFAAMEEARQMHAVAEKKWQAAKAQFERELLGE